MRMQVFNNSMKAFFVLSVPSCEIMILVCLTQSHEAHEGINPLPVPRSNAFRSRRRQDRCVRQVQMHGLAVISHPYLAVLDRELKFHAALRQPGEGRGSVRGQVYHGQVPGASETAFDLVQPYAYAMAAIGEDEYPGRSSAGLANAFLVGLAMA
jgi:hypothetical protein